MRRFFVLNVARDFVASKGYHRGTRSGGIFFLPKNLLGPLHYLWQVPWAYLQCGLPFNAQKCGPRHFSSCIEKERNLLLGKCFCIDSSTHPKIKEISILEREITFNMNLGAGQFSLCFGLYFFEIKQIMQYCNQYHLGGIGMNWISIACKSVKCTLFSIKRKNIVTYNLDHLMR